MIDIEHVKKNRSILDQALRNRNKEPLENELLALEEDYRNAHTSHQKLLEERNALTQAFVEAKGNAQDVQEILKKVEILKSALEQAAMKLTEAKSAYLELLHSIPNIPSDECPVGMDETSNLEIRRFGEPRKFDFKPKEHYEIGEALGLMDFKSAARIAGSRFVFLFSKLAKLERALAQFMLDVHTKENGYTEVYPPLLLKENAMFGVGQLPKFEEDLFKTTVDSYLIPTAEASLTNVFADTVLQAKDLPLRYTAYTPCFRSEAGAAGKDTAGMLRQHQFGKVELVSITTPEASKQEHERMLEAAEGILRRLKIPFRTIVLSTGDMGFCSEKTYDIEVWLPGQNAYREISSCSRCGAFQARRMATRYKNPKTNKNEFVHTLNGSGLAVGRSLIAVIENYQQKDNIVEIPEVLIPYCGFEKIEME